MLSKSFSILVARLSHIILNFALVLITVKYLGAQVRGEINLIILYVTICTLFSGLFAGPALNYYFEKFEIKKVYIIAIIFSIIISIMVIYIIHFFSMMSHKLLLHVSLMSTALNIFLVHQYYYIAHNQLNRYNLFLVIQIIAQVILTIVLLLFNLSIYAYTWAYIISHLLVIFISVPKFYNSNTLIQSYAAVFNSLVTHGVKTQLANASQFLSNRFYYFVLGSTLGLAFLGKFGIVIMLIEVILLVVKSISIQLFTMIKLNNDILEKKKILIKGIHTGILLSILFFVTILFIPQYLWEIILSKEFKDIKIWTLILAPSLIFQVVHISISAYWSGEGEYNYNLYNSIGAAITMLFTSLALIAKFKFIGIAIVLYSVSFFQCAYGYYVFNKKNYAIKLAELLPNLSDVKVILSELKKSKI